MLYIKSIALETIYSHGIETFPEECCGILASPNLEERVIEAVRCSNIQNELHKKDSKKYRRTAKKAYSISGLEWMKIENELNEKGYYYTGIYHSHSNGKAYFSQKDRKGAMLDGKPIQPKARYLIIGVKDRKVYDRKSFIWDIKQKDFVEEEIKIIE